MDAKRILVFDGFGYNCTSRIVGELQGLGHTVVLEDSFSTAKKNVDEFDGVVLIGGVPKKVEWAENLARRKIPVVVITPTENTLVPPFAKVHGGPMAKADDIVRTLFG
ncbi:MAG: hypothetical protein Q8N56_03105 [bacterium]|nr:hypothetical protein [bacterium]